MHDLLGSSRQAPCGTGICTLFEGDYHFGLAAFLNSLVHSGYAGTVWAGYRGALPPWLHRIQSVKGELGAYMVTDHVRLVLLPLQTELHFTNYKPQFMLDLFDGPASGCDYLWYFDPDIFIRCNWAFFAEWQEYGVALCQEIVNNILPPDSPLRRQWMRVAASLGFSNPRPLHHYFSGGTVGISAVHRSFLDVWRRILERAEEEGLDRNTFRVSSWGREMPFFASDQDALNVAAMYTEHPLTTMGPEAMGFVPGGFTMYHVVGPKPWRARFLRRALAGVPPGPGDKFFFTQVSSPIRAYTPMRLRIKRLSCSIAAVIGRFYARR